jgi:hypothetical protein
MGRKKPTRLRATPARLTTARMRGDDKDGSIGNPFLLFFQGQGCLNRTLNIFSVEYKPEVSQGGSVICPIFSLMMSQAFLGNLLERKKRGIP